MDLLKKLIEKYGYNEPIFICELTIEGYSNQTLRQSFKRLADSGELARFDTGTYYIPTYTLMGKSLLNPRRVIEKKYISDKNKVFGYYSGITLENNVGITTQMPNVIEIVTNKEKSRVRSVRVGMQIVRLRKGRTTINSKNVDALQVLDILNGTEYKRLDNGEKNAFLKFIRSKNLSQQQVFEIAKNYPVKAMKNMIESGVIYEFTQKSRAI